MCVLFRFLCPRRTTGQMSKHITLLNSDKAVLSGSHNTSSSSGILGHNPAPKRCLLGWLIELRANLMKCNKFLFSFLSLISPEFRVWRCFFFDVPAGVGRSTFCLFRLQVFLICLSIVPKWWKLRKVFTLEVSTNKYVLKYCSYVLNRKVLLEFASYLVTSHCSAAGKNLPPLPLLLSPSSSLRRCWWYEE